MDRGIAHIYFALLALGSLLALFGRDSWRLKVLIAGFLAVCLAGLVLSYTPVLR